MRKSRWSQIRKMFRSALPETIVKIVVALLCALLERWK
jgi:hypothetical protein